MELGVCVLVGDSVGYKSVTGPLRALMLDAHSRPQVWL